MRVYFILFSILLLPLACLAAEKLTDGLYAEIETSKGKITVTLEYEKTPLTVANFVGLAEGTKKFTAQGRKEGKPYYDGLSFHRVIADFMIQSGCPLGTGTGSPGYRFDDEIDPTLNHTGPGILSMVNSGPGTNGSQFFITHKATPWLDGKHTIFGGIVEGMQVLNKIAEVEVDKTNKHPKIPVVIKKISILRIGKKAEAFRGDEEHFNKIKEDKVRAKRIIYGLRMKREEEQIQDLISKYRKENEGIELVMAKSGLRYFVLKDGKGKTPTVGTRVRIHLTSTLANGKKISSSRARNLPMNFPVGKDYLPAGLDMALMQMKKGERRLLIVPDKLAFGERGAGGGLIPPFATLVYDVELVDF